MNPASLPVGVPPDVPIQPEWQHQVEAWRELTTQCARKPSRKRVHALRRLTLRLRAAMEQALQEQTKDSAAARAFRGWKKEGKKLRRALGPVRDADVYLTRLDGLRNPSGGSPSGKSDHSQRCLREIDKFAARLEAERQSGAEELTVVLAAHSKRRDRRSLKLEKALASGTPAKARSTAKAALEIFAGLTSEFPALDAANLHAYRKRLKQALYLAEISAATDPLAKRLTAAFRKIHMAAGEWHDWQTLAGKAAHTLPAHGKQDGLASVLEALAQGLSRGLSASAATPQCGSSRVPARFGLWKSESLPKQNRQTAWMVTPAASDQLGKPHENSVQRGKPTAYSWFVIPRCAAKARRIQPCQRIRTRPDRAVLDMIQRELQGGRRERHQDLRAYERFELGDDRGSLIYAGSRTACQVVDISLGGCCLRTDIPFTAGALAPVEVALPICGMMVRIRGITQWTRLQYLVGVRFVHSDSRSKNLLAGLLTCLADGSIAEVVKEAIAAEAGSRSATRSSSSALAVELAQEGAQSSMPAATPEVNPKPEETPASPPAETPENSEDEGLKLEDGDWSVILHLLKDGSQLAGVVTALNQEGCSVRITEPFIAGIHIRVEVEFRMRGLPFRLAGVTEEVHEKHAVDIRFLHLSQRKLEALAQVLDEAGDLTKPENNPPGMAAPGAKSASLASRVRVFLNPLTP